MVQNFRIVAACFFQGIGKGRKADEGPVVVDLLGQMDHLGGEPGGVEGDGVEGIADDVTDQSHLNLALLGSKLLPDGIMRGRPIIFFHNSIWSSTPGYGIGKGVKTRE